LDYSLEFTLFAQCGTLKLVPKKRSQSLGGVVK